VIFFVLGQVETVIMGVVTLVMMVLFVAAVFSSKARPSLGAVHLGYLVPYLVTGFILQLVWFISLYQRCVSFLDLSQRVANELTRDNSCYGPSSDLQKFIFVLMWIGIVAFVYIQVHLCVIGWKYFKFSFDEAPFANCATKRTCLLIIGFVIGMLVLIAVFALMFSPHGIDRKKEGSCPVQPDFFFEVPEENDVDCCIWQQNATCCHRSVCIPDHKPGASTIPGSSAEQDKCNDLLGLLNCAPCRYDSGTFLSFPPSSESPWNQGNLTVCRSFCDELFNSCFPNMGFTTKICAFGDSCRFKTEGVVTNYTAANSTGIEGFCRDFGLAVSTTNCYSSSFLLVPSSVSLYLFLCLAVFMVTARI
jgi:uncharacterized membrane protein